MTFIEFWLYKSDVTRFIRSPFRHNAVILPAAISVDSCWAAVKWRTTIYWELMGNQFSFSRGNIFHVLLVPQNALKIVLKIIRYKSCPRELEGSWKWSVMLWTPVPSFNTARHSLTQLKKCNPILSACVSENWGHANLYLCLFLSTHNPIHNLPLKPYKRKCIIPYKPGFSPKACKLILCVLQKKGVHKWYPKSRLYHF